MSGRSLSTRRKFVGGWLSDDDASIMALIWQFDPGPSSEGCGHFEAEVIRGVDKIASLRGESVDEIRRTLDDTYGAKEPADASTGSSRAGETNERSRR